MSAVKQKTLKSYLIGFIFSVILTLLAFVLVEKNVLPDDSLYICVAILAIMQLIVQSICFLGMSWKAEGKWNLLPYLFVILIIAILAGGSLWIMYNLDYNMTH